MGYKGGEAVGVGVWVNVIVIDGRRVRVGGFKVGRGVGVGSAATMRAATNTNMRSISSRMAAGSSGLRALKFCDIPELCQDQGR